MSLALFLVEAGTLPASGPYELTGDEGRHAAKVRRLRAGEHLELSDGAGVVAECVVAEVGAGLTVEIRTVRTVPAPSPRLVVAQALPKGDRGELAVELMTEIGVDAIVPWAAEHCVTVWSGEKAHRAAQRWNVHAREAAKQARRPWVPVIEPLADTKTLAARVADAELAVVLHESATEALTAVSLPATGEVLLVVGPEGGISAEELTVFQDAGARVCRLGPEVLRTSTAGLAALAALLPRTSRWT
ncbi:MAG TPA: 16S rRNA (uracil(1498)-N(3))-methyltransferase [Sporichthyaceae bacterium]|nr:16S rRNA (uracil(1498)-N(3))-methyltransferase [Sporichthyaceae bacterium]